MEDEYICNRLEQLKKLKGLEGSELVKGFETIGCDCCSGNYYDCEDYVPNYEVNNGKN